MMTEQTQELTWQWHVRRGKNGVYVVRSWAPPGDTLLASGSYEAVQAARRLLSGQAVRP